MTICLSQDEMNELAECLGSKDISRSNSLESMSTLSIALDDEDIKYSTSYTLPMNTSP